MPSPKPAPDSTPASSKFHTARRLAARDRVTGDLRLSDGASRLYDLLDSMAGLKGFCFPYQAENNRQKPSLNARMGISRRELQKRLAELTANGHVFTKRTGRGNYYVLSWVAAIGPNAHWNTLPDAHRCALEYASDAYRRAHAFKEDPYQESAREGESSSSSAADGKGGFTAPVRGGYAAPAPPPAIDAGGKPQRGDNPHPNEDLKHAVGQALLAWVESEGFEMPSGQIPEEVIAQQMRRVGASIRDLMKFLQGEYIERLTDPPATWKHVDKSVLVWLGAFNRVRSPTDPSEKARDQWKAQMREERKNEKAATEK